MGGFLHRFARLNAAFLVRELRRLADEIERLEPGPPVLSYIVFHPPEGVVMADITVKDTSAPLAASVQFLDAEGQATTPDDVPQWTSSDESVALLTVADDGLSVSAEIGGVGASLVEVSSTTADGDVITGRATITSEPDEPATAEITFTPAP